MIGAPHEQGTTGLKVVSNNCGMDDRGLGVLLAAGHIAHVTGSYVGDNKEFAREHLSGELRWNWCRRARRPNGRGPAVQASAPKETRDFRGRPHVLERAITTDFALTAT